MTACSTYQFRCTFRPHVRFERIDETINRPVSTYSTIGVVSWGHMGLDMGAIMSRAGWALSRFSGITQSHDEEQRYRRHESDITQEVKDRATFLPRARSILHNIFDGDVTPIVFCRQIPTSVWLIGGRQGNCCTLCTRCSDVFEIPFLD
ncbi:hypothetical protein ACJJTC_007450 [Scirpophaga incertulas]